jgi:dUTP pyrophosphatase
MEGNTNKNVPPFPVWQNSCCRHETVVTSLPMGMKPYTGPELKVKKLAPEAIIPTKANKTDAGYDLYALEDVEIPAVNHKLIKTGISMAIPAGYVGLIWPRSGLAYKNGLDVFAGVIDAGYRGDVGVILYNSRVTDHYQVKKGDRIAQIVFQKIKGFNLIEVDDLDESQRGEGGFGSSGV